MCRACETNIHGTKIVDDFPEVSSFPFVPLSSQEPSLLSLHMLEAHNTGFLLYLAFLVPALPALNPPSSQRTCVLCSGPSWGSVGLLNTTIFSPVPFEGICTLFRPWFFFIIIIYFLTQLCNLLFSDSLLKYLISPVSHVITLNWFFFGV